VWKKDKFGKGDKVKVLTINPWLTQVRIYQQHRHNHSGEATKDCMRNAMLIQGYNEHISTIYDQNPH